MKRDYNTGKAESITFFTGKEIETTPAYGMETLFVVGVHDPYTILHIADDTKSYVDESKKIKHIYFGANQSFKPNGTNDVDTWRPWEDMIYVCLEAGYWCTLDLDVRDVEEADDYFGKMYDVYVDVIIPEVTNEDDISILYNYLKMYESDTADEWAFLSDKKLNSGMTMVHVLSINGINWKDMNQLINTTEEDVERIIPNKYEI